MTVNIATVYQRSTSPGPQPNGLQAAEDGLWYIDQRNNKVYKLDWDSGDEILSFDTTTEHASGITIGGGYVWVSSTFGLTIHKIDMQTGKTVQELPTPGVGQVAFSPLGAAARDSGAHGLEWRDDKLWIAVPPSQMIYQVDPSNGDVLHSFKAPGLRVHGIAFDEDGHLWSADTASGVVSLLDVSDGRVINYIRVPWPTEVHGLTIDSAGKLWYCDAETTAVGILGR
ncbi:MAG: hypothetical protein HOC77_12550 [Chloroflexi bacterium]|jgi:DNA-binding beta-propeller fold protein YncE|nr:hypothetical protein [Chloroflexota bacterium]MBT4074225.1 hypothetical protein [Chloroflexota bacterium]MBT4515906.1 hypothetical protein [Chloroflexota bacterium]MBT6682421.1 hypothetical protein [Chloroflexota bacterium]